MWVMRRLYIRTNLAVLAGVALAFLVVRLTPWLRSVVPCLPVCLSDTVFHRPCPMCGLTSAFHFLVHGNVGAAFAQHPLSVPLAIILVAECVFRTALLLVPLPERVHPSIRHVDVLLHLVLTALYLVYALLHVAGR